MKRPRPYIPLAVRVELAEQYCEKGLWWPLYCTAVEAGGMTLGRRFAILIGHLPKGVQLDHDPALILREFNARTGKYTPDANDPAHLVYREKADHQQKTTGRKPGAERTVTTKGSDIGLKTKFARLERKKTAKAFGFQPTPNTLRALGATLEKPKRKIPSRQFSTQKRKFR
jgi:hypothetical protein